MANKKTNPKKKKQQKKALPASKSAGKSTRKSASNSAPARKSASKSASKSVTFSIKNVRCFAETQALKIKPLTFLTGENSTGKTTILGCFHIVSKLISDRPVWSGFPDFNREPYEMGSFNDIVRNISNGELVSASSGKKSKSKEQKQLETAEFELGLLSEKPKAESLIVFKKKTKGEEPSIKSITIKAEGDDDDTSLTVDYGKSLITGTSKKDKTSIEFKDLDKDIINIPYIPPFILLHLIRERLSVADKKKKDKKHPSDTIKFLKKFENIVNSTFSSFPIIPMAPVRSKPQRTYNHIRESMDPEGKEIPMTLMLLNANAEEKWRKLYSDLLNFGKASGLFSDIIVKRFEKSASGPFQLRFEIKGAKSNIIDTGYGISQILPLLVHIFRAPKKSQFLLQQPEVHLHPKAQAELSSLLIQSIKTKKHSFMVETHSDYMVDRARIEIQKGNISPDEVSLIYLEHTKDGSVKAHNISFDKEGNVLNTPPGYRDFFLKETDQVLGFGDEA